MSSMFKIKKENLLILAGVVWAIAGVNVAFLGAQALSHFSGWAFAGLVLAAFAVFAAFGGMFHKMMAKHVSRIRSYAADRLSAFLFFDARGYVIMIFMMTMGFGLRAFGLVPEWFVAFFYTGLGVALTLAGVAFLVARFCSAEAIAAMHHGHRGHRAN